MRIVLDIEEEDIERITTSLDHQYAYTLSRDCEDSGYKRLAELFRGFLKRGPGQATSLPKRLADLFRGFLKRGSGQAASPSKDQPALKKPPSTAKSQRANKTRSA